MATWSREEGTERLVFGPYDWTRREAVRTEQLGRFAVRIERGNGEVEGGCTRINQTRLRIVLSRYCNLSIDAIF